MPGRRLLLPVVNILNDLDIARIMLNSRHGTLQKSTSASRHTRPRQVVEHGQRLLARNESALRPHGGLVLDRAVVQLVHVSVADGLHGTIALVRLQSRLALNVPVLVLS